MNILELFAHIGLKADTKQGIDFNNVVKNIQENLVKTAIQALSFAAAIKTINDAFSDTLSLKRFEQNTGLATERLQQWRYVASQVSGSADAVNASIEAIATNQEKIKFGQGSIKGYQLLGIDPNSDPFEVLEQLRQKMQGLPAEMKRNIAQEFGVSRELVATLELTNNQFDQMRKSAFIIPQESIDKINKFRADISVLQNRLDYLKNEIVAKMSPVITEFLDKIIKWTSNNQDKIVSGLKTVYSITRDVEQLFSHFAIVIDGLIKSTIGWGNALKAVIIAIGAAMISTPFGAFIAGFTAILLVIDDLYTYVSGKGKSVFGEIVDKFPEAGKAFSWLTDMVSGLGSILNYIFTGNASKFDEFIAKWDKLGGIFKLIANAIKEIKTFFTSGPSPYVPEEYRMGGETGTELTGIDTKKAVSGAAKEVGNIFTRFGEWVKKTYEQGSYKNMSGSNTVNNTENSPVTNNSKTENIHTDNKIVNDKILNTVNKTENKNMSNFIKNIKNNVLYKNGNDIESTTNNIKNMASSPVTHNNYTENNNTTVNADINVTGVTDPVRAGNATAEALRKEIDNTKNSTSRTKKEK